MFLIPHLASAEGEVRRQKEFYFNYSNLDRGGQILIISRAGNVGNVDLISLLAATGIN